MTLGNRQSKEHFYDVLDDLKRSFSSGKKSCSDVELTLLKKKVFPKQ